MQEQLRLISLVLQVLDKLKFGARGKVKGAAVHPEGTINVSTKVHGSPSDSFQDISLKTINSSLIAGDILLTISENCDLQVALEDSRFYPLRTVNVCIKFHGDLSNIC